MTTPTVTEADATNMPGVYFLLCDEDTTLAAGNDTEEIVFHITQASMAPVTQVVELYRPKITEGNTLDVTATGAAGIDWGNIENKTTANDLSGTDIQLADTVTTLTGHTAQTGDSYARLGAPAGASVSADVAAVKSDTGNILTDTADMQPKLGTPTDFGSGTSTLAANLQDLADDGTAVYDRSTDSLQAIRDRGDSAWTTGAGGSPPQLLQNTTIATLASQTSFTLTAGSADDDAYNGAVVVVTDSATSTQKAVGSVSDYTGSTKTVTLSADPAIFTMAVGDTIDIIANASTAPTAAAVADAVWDEALAGHVAAGSYGKAVADTETDAAAILVDTGTTLDAAIAVIDANVDQIEAAVITNAAGVDIAADVAAVKAETALIVADTNELQTDDVPGLIAALNDPTAAAVADAVWDEVLTGATHNVTDSAGRRLRQIEASFVVAAGTAQAGTAATITLAASESATDDIFSGDRVIIVGGTGVGEHGLITAYNGTTKVATMSQNWVITPDNTSEYELSPADVDVETWQHGTVSVSATSSLPEVDAKSISDSTAAADSVQANIGNLDAAISGLNDPTAAAVAGAVLDEALSGHVAAGSLGKAVADIETDAAAILVDTAEIGAAGAGLTALATQASVNTVDGIVDAILVDTGTTLPASLATAQADLDTLTGTDGVTLATAQANYAPATAASVAALNDLSAAAVNAEVVDALATDTYAEPAQGAPGATVSLAAKINYLYKAWRNKTEQTATTRSLYNDAGSVVDHKATVSDDGTTYTDGEIVSGP
jgi:hypothetical protein